MSLSIVTGRKPAFNFQCLRPQSSVDDLPVPGSYAGSTTPSRSRLQVKRVPVSSKRQAFPIFIHCCVSTDPAQHGLPAQQRVVAVISLLGKHNRSWCHSSSKNNCPVAAQGQAHLHPYDPGGRSHRHQPAAVERRIRQPPHRKPPQLVPRSVEDFYQHEDASG